MSCWSPILVEMNEIDEMNELIFNSWCLTWHALCQDQLPASWIFYHSESISGGD